MDWLQSNKTKNRAIIILIALNMLTMAMVWIEKSKTGIQEDKPSSSTALISKELNLEQSQAAKIEKSRSDKLGQIKLLNDSTSRLKKELADELFSEHPDTQKVSQYAAIIGSLQSRIEILRFMHFNELLSVCTPEQKNKLKPIINEVFNRKPPKPRDEVNEHSEPENKNVKPEPQQPPQPQADSTHFPLKKEEKLEKFAERLNLTAAQKMQLRKILFKSEQRGDELRAKKNPDRNQIDAEKEKIRIDEDNEIMSILTADQKSEFIKMQEKRRKEK